MPNYSVATTKDKLASLIDKALAGEEVVITRHGKPTAKLSAVEAEHVPKRSKDEWLEKLKQLRDLGLHSDTNSVDLIRQMREEGEH